MLKHISLLLISIFLAANSISGQTGLQTVTGFGTNPGNLNMHSYVPAGITGKAALVLALHGCGQDATVYATQSGWDKLADEHQFYVVYPEQNTANNGENCFNWFLPNDQTRGHGEALSIAQMVYYMQSHYNIDSNRIFVTGLSAGACMTNIMLACYPDIFNAGGIMSGVPYKAATNVPQSDSVLLGEMTHTPQAWGDSVRNAYPGYTGSYPRVAVFQGTADAISNPQNAREVMKQWTSVDSAGQIPAVVDSSFNGNALVTQSIYDNSAGTPVVETFFITGMPHGIALDTGSCYQQGGETGPFALEVHLYSSFWAAYFFDILGNDSITISGLQLVTASQNNVTYSVANTPGATYHWAVPQGATIVSGQGTNQITVNFSSFSGNISVTKSSTDTCENGPVNLFVTVATASAINNLPNKLSEVNIFPNPTSGIFYIETNAVEKQNIRVLDVTGKLVLSQVVNGHDGIDASSLASGIYMLITSYGETSISRRLVICK